MHGRYLWGLFILGVLFGCSSQPKPSGYWFDSQQKMQSVKHWEILAKDISSTFASTIISEQIPNTQIFIDSSDNSSFGRSLKSFLATDLIKDGIAVASYPDAALHITWNVQIVRTDFDRHSDIYPGTITSLSAIGYGVYKATTGSTAVAVVGSGVAADAAYQIINMNNIDVPHNEIIVNANLVNLSGDIVTRDSYIYYINNEDTWHYSESRDSILDADLKTNTKIYKISR